MIRKERAQCSDCVLLSAGDLVQGPPISTIFHGLPVFEIANLFGFDAATLGNRDFDYGWIEARKFIHTATIPSFPATSWGAGGRLFTPKPYVILRVNGLRVAVIGAMTEELRTLSTPKVMEDWHAVSVIEAARKDAAALYDRTGLVVLLGHIHDVEEDQFRSEATEIPVLVTGHIPGGLEHEVSRNGRVVVRVKGYGEELGRLELTVDTEKKAPVSWTWKRLPVDGREIEPAGDVAVRVNRWEDEVSNEVDQPVAVSRRHFDPSEIKHLIEQAMRDETGADFAFINQGGVRDILLRGPVAGATHLERHAIRQSRGLRQVQRPRSATRGFRQPKSRPGTRVHSR